MNGENFKCLICGGNGALTQAGETFMHLQCLKDSWQRLLSANVEAQCLIGGQRYEEAAVKLLDAVPKTTL